jgi:hypothetical protein
MMLYCPGVFAGHRKMSGLRNALAKLFGVKPFAIDENISDMLFFYGHSREYAREVESVYAEICRRL